MRAIRLSIKLPLLAITSVLLMAMAVGLLTIVAGRSILRSTVQEDNINRVRIYAQAVAFYLDSARSLLETTADLREMRDPALTPPPDSESREVTAEAGRTRQNIAELVLKHSNLFENIMLMRVDGTVYLIEPQDLKGRMSHNDLSFTAWYKELMKTGRTVVSNLHISPATQRPTVIIATPVRDNKQNIVGIWAGELRLEELSRIGQADTPKKGSSSYYGYVTDGRGLVLTHQKNARYVKEQTDFSSVPVVRYALAGQQGAAQYINPIEEEEKLGAYTPLRAAVSQFPDGSVSPAWAVVYAVSTQAAFEPIERLSHLILVISAGATLVMSILSMGVARRITQPLRRLTAAAERIGAGDFSQPCEAGTGDEIGILANEFNFMVTSLAEKKAQLSEYTERLEHAVAERTASLGSQTQELERSNKELEQFAYVASHDLREPLRKISNFTELLANRYKGQLDEKADKYIWYVVDGAHRMERLIEDLLTYSRAGRAELQLEPTSVEHELKKTLADLETLVRETGAEVTCGHLPVVKADPTQLGRVLQNLIANAVKFRGEEAPRIHLSAEKQGKEWVFSVKDNGIGIDPQHADRVFQIFQRLHARSEYPGTGIGLAVCKKIIERHGGRIWVESEPGKGATFYFTLPLMT